ncbi:MAG: hypothetical protein KKB59_10445 [Spirochaetes bacterium]|nr:hypothetical protein [Spirochaetota bacterium]
MAELEREVMDRRLRALGCVGAGAESSPYRRFRINAGSGWVAAPGDTLHVKKAMSVRVYPGDMVLRRARPFIGAPAGWADLVGWDSVIIGEEMVGQRVAVFAMDELKSAGVRLSKDQRDMGELVTRWGGRFEVIR